MRDPCDDGGRRSFIVSPSGPENGKTVSPSGFGPLFATRGGERTDVPQLSHLNATITLEFEPALGKGARAVVTAA
jgi:hypothetical protein